MNRIQLVDLDILSEEEETGGVVILRQEMQSRLGWLSTEVEPHMKQETETMEIVKEVEEVHKEAQIQATQENQLSHALTSTDTLEVTEVVRDEYVEISREQKDIVEK